MKTILLTGCDGFIGSHVAEELLNNGYKIIGIDNNSKYKFPYQEHHKHLNFEFYKYDIIKNPELTDVFHEEKFDAVIHAAAIIGGIEMFHKRPFDIIRDNAIMDAKIIDLASYYEKKFIGLSSSMVYENANIWPTPESCIDNIRRPHSSYGQSKLIQEDMIKAAHEQENLQYTIIRPFNAIGVRENDFLEGKSSHVLPDLILKCLRDDYMIDILGDGTQVRHYTDVRDISRGIRLALECPEAINTDFNISTDKSTTVLMLAKKVWYKIHPDKPFKYISKPAYKHDVQKRIPCTKKAKDVLGFESKIPLDTTIDLVIDYIKNAIQN